MIKILPTLIGILFLNTLKAQDTFRFIEGNNVRATISNSTRFFTDLDDGYPGYESPKDGENHLIYSTSFWFGAIDLMGNLRMAADIFGGDFRDTYPGALTNDGSAEAPELGYATDIYLVSRADIESHATNFYMPDYVTPHGILEWPAHGDVDLGLDYQLAPFADLNGNMIYEPELGEYPEIRGDHAAYLIMNDKAGPHTCSGGEPLGIEIHYMFYQFKSEDDLNNTTFVNVRVINRSTMMYPEFIVGTYMNSDIGYAHDDYIGCSPENDLIFGYNADNFDEGSTGPGYGENPPAVGMMLLNRGMEVAGYFEMSAAPHGYPTTPVEFWNYLNASWRDGTHFTYGEEGRTGDIPTNFIYPSDPTEILASSWSEASIANVPFERRVFMASEPISLPAGGTACFDYAVLTSSRLGDSFENASALISQAPIIQAFYEDMPNVYCDFTLNDNEMEAGNPVTIYPNPSNGTFNVDLAGNFDLTIFSLDGRTVYSEQNVNEATPIDANLARGSYVIKLTQNNTTYQSKIVIRN